MNDLPPPPWPEGRMSMPRLVFVIIGASVMISAGGCSLLFYYPAKAYQALYLIPWVGGIPFAVGALIVLLTLKLGRKSGAPVETPGTKREED